VRCTPKLFRKSSRAWLKRRPQRPVPTARGSAPGFDQTYQSISTPECRDVLIATLIEDTDDHEQSLTQLTFFGITETWLILTVFVAFYLRWLKPPNTVMGYDIAVDAIAVRQHVPFIDMREWAQHIQKFG
jgi:hypothetical protein